MRACAQLQNSQQPRQKFKAASEKNKVMKLKAQKEKPRHNSNKAPGKLRVGGVFKGRRAPLPSMARAAVWRPCQEGGNAIPWPPLNKKRL